MKAKTLTLFGFFFLCISFCSWGQNDKKLDSLLKLYKEQNNDISKLSTLNALFQITKKNQLEEALAYSKEQMALAKSLQNKEEIADANNNYANYFEIVGSYDSASVYYGKAKKFWDNSKNIERRIKASNSYAAVEYNLGKGEKALKIVDSTLKLIDSAGVYLDQKGRSYDIMGNIHLSYGNNKHAFEYFVKAEKIYDMIGDTLNQAGALDNIGYVEYEIGNYEKSIDYIKQAAKVYEQKDDKYLMVRAYQYIGMANFNLDQKDSAQVYFEKGLKIALKAGLIRRQAPLYEYLGKIKNEAKNYEEGIPLIEKSIEINKKTNELRALAYATENLATTYMDMEDWRTALYYLNEAEKVYEQFDDHISPSLYNSRSICYEKLGHFDKALIEYKKFKSDVDITRNEKKVKELERLRAEFETEKKEQQLALQEKEITVLEQKAKINTQQRWLLGGGMTLSLMALGFGFYGFRQKTKRNQLEKDKVEAELAFKKKELTTHALHLAKKNEVLENVKLKAKDLKLQGDTKGYQELIKTINFDQQDDKNWESFTQYFEQVHKDFAKNVKNKYPDVTKNELRFMALLKMNMSSKEIATILNISPDGIKKARQRLRKKMALTPEISLENTVLAI